MSLKILYHHRIASKDGMYVHVEEILNSMYEKNIPVEVVCPKFNEESDFGYEGGFAAKIRAALPQWIYEILELCYGVLVAFKLIRAIVRFKPDVIYERYNLYQPVGVFIAKLFGLPILLEINAPLAEERKKHNGLALFRFAKAIENYTWRNATYLLPVTQVLAEHVTRVGVSESKVVVIPNGINKKVFDTLANVSERNLTENITVGFVGFINKWHRLDLALKAIAQCENKKVRLICVGDGDILPELKSLAQQLGIADQVEFTGLVTRDKIFQYVEKFDIALQPSVTAYASPLKLFEYLAVGSLVVAPNSKNILEVLSEDCAVLFDEGDFDDFVDKLDNAIGQFSNFIEHRKRAQNLVIERKYYWQSNVDKIVQLAESARTR